MAENEDEGPSTQPADVLLDSASTLRPMATQAIFRPQFDDDDYPSDTAGTEPHDHPTTATRAIAPARRLGGGLVEIPGCPRSIRSPP